MPRFRSARVLLLLPALAGDPSLSVHAQCRAQQPYPPTDAHHDSLRGPAFEVISILPSNPGNLQWSLSIHPNGDEYRSIGRPLGDTILDAYFSRALQRRERLPGAPAWIWNDKFDIVAKVAPADLEAWHQSIRHGFAGSSSLLQTMLQAALRDRCKLVVHRVPATYPGFALVLANHGPNPKRFLRSKPGEAIPDDAMKGFDDGRMTGIKSSEDPVTHFYETSTASLAATMSGWGEPVEDRTGLTGKYDFALRRLSTEGDPSIDWDLAALGLKLEPIKIPIENIIIDHIEYPSPN